IDILLMNSLLKAVSPGTILVLIGDVDQLPRLFLTLVPQKVQLSPK
ncbi:unnamed protein product, partial [marine sediment metagenome]